LGASSPAKEVPAGVIVEGVTREFDEIGPAEKCESSQAGRQAAFHLTLTSAAATPKMAGMEIAFSLMRREGRAEGIGLSINLRSHSMRRRFKAAASASGGL